MHDGKDIMLRLTFANAGTVTVIAMVTNPESGRQQLLPQLIPADAGKAARPLAWPRRLW